MGFKNTDLFGFTKKTQTPQKSIFWGFKGFFSVFKEKPLKKFRF